MGKLVFLGGTVAGNNWREGFIERLVARGVPSEAFFNPVVTDWNEEAQRREEEAKRKATHFLYYLADPMQEGNPLSGYSMVEATMALYDHQESAVVVFDTTGMDGHALKAMAQTEKVLRRRHPNANIFGSVQEAEEWLATELTKKKGLFS